jgi:hypothetical protein
MRGVNGRGLVNRLYQWLSKRASYFRIHSSGGGISRTVRTEVTIEQQAIALHVSGPSVDLEHCPLCGQKLAALEGEHPRLCLPKDSTSQTNFPVDDSPP